MDARQSVNDLRSRMAQSIIGQTDVIDRLVIGLLANGNLLIEGLPGLAKTRAVKAMARNLDARFSRIQFTPDLLPSDVTGAESYHQTETGGVFRFDPGPIFANIVLADEINRAPAKVQAALLEAMEERQVTVAGKTHRMAPLFIVMATQNPVEQEGTYPLPEAQMDRFLMHVEITYGTPEEEVEVIRLVRGETHAPAPDSAPPIPPEAIFAARDEIGQIHVSDAMDRYMADLVQATRTPEAIDPELARWIEIGASPRASLSLDRAGRAHAWLAGRDYVDPLDLRTIAGDVLRHRLTLSYAAQGDGVTANDVVARLIDRVALP